MAKPSSHDRVDPGREHGREPAGTEAGDRAVEPDEVARLRRALEEERERGLRLLADFDNHRRRRDREDGIARDQGRRAALMPLLPVLDTLERALEAGSTDDAFYQGVAATARQFLSALAEGGAVPIDSVGATFDPRLHEIVATVPADGVEPGTVVREQRRGWLFGGELLRPAQVEVAVPREVAGSWP